MNKIQIMHVAQANGGVGNYINLYLKYSDKERYEHILVCSPDYKAEKYFNHIFETVEMVRDINPITDLKAILCVRRLIRKHKPNLIFTHSSKGGAIGRIAAIGLNIPIIYNPHGWSFQMRVSSSKQFVYQVIEQVLAHFTDAIVAISKIEYKCALDKRICKEIKLKLIYNGIDIQQEVKPMNKEELIIPSNAYVIGTVARIAQGKSPLLFAEVAAKIRKQINNAYFVWVGDGPNASELKDYIKKLGLEDCFLITGWVDEPLSYISVFDIGMLLTRWEGFGYAICEYMQMEKPVIASNIDSVPELIDDHESGLLVQLNEESICKATCELYESRELVETLVKNAKAKVVNNFSAERTAKELDELIEKLCKRTKDEKN